jgi:hypothetical protein
LSKERVKGWFILLINLVLNNLVSSEVVKKFFKEIELRVEKRDLKLKKEESEWLRKCQTNIEVREEEEEVGEEAPQSGTDLLESYVNSYANVLKMSPKEFDYSISPSFSNNSKNKNKLTSYANAAKGSNTLDIPFRLEEQQSNINYKEHDIMQQGNDHGKEEEDLSSNKRKVKRKKNIVIMTTNFRGRDF